MGYSIYALLKPEINDVINQTDYPFLFYLKSKASYLFECDWRGNVFIWIKPREDQNKKANFFKDLSKAAKIKLLVAISDDKDSGQNALCIQVAQLGYSDLAQFIREDF